MSSLPPDRNALAQGEAPARNRAAVGAASFLEIVRTLNRKEQRAASGAGFERFDPTAPGVLPGRQRESAGTFTG